MTVTDTTTNQYWSGSGNDPKAVTSYTLNIMCYGTEATTYDGPWNPNVTGTTVPVHAGWPIQLQAALAPSDLATQFTWTIAGAGGNGSAAINGFAVTANDNANGTLATSTGTVVALVPGNDTKATFPDPASTPAMLQSYYYTTAGNYTASVQPQGVAGVAAVKTTFSVEKPQATIATAGSSIYGGTDIANGADAIDLGDYYLQPQPQNPQLGITFTPTLTAATVGEIPPFRGTYSWIQVYSADQHWYNTNNAVIAHLVSSGIDTYLPYPFYPTNTLDTTDSPSSGPFLPGVPAGCTKLTVDDTATMWFMYTPSGWPADITVPVAKVTWNWGGVDSAGANGAAWNITNPITPGNPAGQATNEYPTWSQPVSHSPQVP